VHDLVTADDSPGVFGKKLQEREGFGPKGTLCAVRQESAAPKVQSKTAEFVYRECRGPHFYAPRKKFQRNFSRDSALRQDISLRIRFDRW
jgi:hypothetical protein